MCLLKRIVRGLQCFALAAFLILPLTACSGKETKHPQGNIPEPGDPQPDDIYAEFIFLDYSDVTVTFKLFPETSPEAVDWFVTRAERGFYDKKNIHRVINDFIMQGGSINFDGTDGEVENDEYFGIETSENVKNFYGALCMAADPSNRNYCQFYIVTNKNPVNIDDDITAIEELLQDKARPLTEAAKARLEGNLEKLKAIPENIKQLYQTRGGAYELDGLTTVFGQLVSGGEVIDAINSVEVAGGNKMDDDLNIKSRPTNEIIIESVKIRRIPRPEPVTSEATTTKKKGKTTTVAESDAVVGDLTEKINMGDQTTAPADESAADTLTAETSADASEEITVLDDNAAQQVAEMVTNAEPVQTEAPLENETDGETSAEDVADAPEETADSLGDGA